MPVQLLASEPSWAEAEFASVALNDVRLDRRCQIIAEAFAQHPTMPINQACEDWADTKAAYHFMANRKVSPGQDSRAP